MSLQHGQYSMSFSPPDAPIWDMVIWIILLLCSFTHCIADQEDSDILDHVITTTRLSRWICPYDYGIYLPATLKKAWRMALAASPSPGMRTWWCAMATRALLTLDFTLDMEALWTPTMSATIKKSNRSLPTIKMRTPSSLVGCRALGDRRCPTSQRPHLQCPRPWPCKGDTWREISLPHTSLMALICPWSSVELRASLPSCHFLNVLGILLCFKSAHKHSRYLL